LVPPRDEVPYLEPQFRFTRGRNRLAIDRNCQAITDARNCNDCRMVFIPHSLSQLRDRRRQRSIHDHDIWPNRFQELFFGDDLAGMEKKLEKEVQRLGLELYHFAFDPQLPPQFIQFIVGKAPHAADGLRNASCRSLEDHRVTTL
jgi:hypothetical protein